MKETKWGGKTDILIENLNDYLLLLQCNKKGKKISKYYSLLNVCLSKWIKDFKLCGGEGGERERWMWEDQLFIFTPKLVFFSFFLERVYT